MSDLMDAAVINMPYELAMSDDLSRKQFYSRAQAVLKERDEALAKLAAMENELSELRAYKEAAEKQEPYGYFLPGQGGNVFTREIGNCKIAERFNWPVVNLYANPLPADKPVTRQDVIDALLSTRGQSEGVTADSILGLLSDKAAAPSHSQQSAEAHDKDKNAQRYLWIKENIQEELTQESLKDSEYAEHKTCYKLPLLISWADFCGHISLDDAIDNQISRGDLCPSHESEQSASPAPAYSQSAGIERAYREGWETGWAERHSSLNNDARVNPWIIPAGAIDSDWDISDAKKCELPASDSEQGGAA